MVGNSPCGRLPGPRGMIGPYAMVALIVAVIAAGLAFGIALL